MTIQDAEFRRMVFHSEISPMFDQEARFNPGHKRKVRMIANALRKPPGQVHKPSKAILRNSFLYGCREFTGNEPVEHLMVGFGRRRGGGTDSSSLPHITGDAGSVPVPPPLREMIQRHAMNDPRHETILFHNYPSYWLNAALPILPENQTEQALLLHHNLGYSPLFGPDISPETLSAGPRSCGETFPTITIPPHHHHPRVLLSSSPPPHHPRTMPSPSSHLPSCEAHP